MKKILFSMLVVGLFSFAGSIDVLASCATGENDSMCIGGQTSLNQSCGTGKTCQRESCDESSWVYSCMTAPASNATSGETTTSGSSVLTNNCSGTCRTSCASAGETRSSNVSEYCGTDGYECCVTVNTCTNTAGNSCKSDMCSTLDGMQSSSGTCPTGEYCCRATASTDTCTSTRGNSCEGDLCSTLDGMQSASGTCPTGEYCCKAKSAAASSSSGSYSTEWEKETSSSGTAWNVQSAGEFGLPTGTIAGIIESLVAWILGIFGFLGIITFVIAGIFYFTAAGDAEMEKKAKNAMKMGIIGIVVGLIGFVIIQAVDLLLNAKTSF